MTYRRSTISPYSSSTTVAGRGLMTLRPSIGQTYVDGEAMWTRSWCFITTNQTTSVRTAGTGGAATTTGTVAAQAVNAARGYQTQITATSGTNGQVQTVNIGMFRGATTDVYGGFEANSKCIFTDASYNNTGAATGSRIWGLCLASNATNIYGSDRGGTQDLVGFNREHVNGANTDTNWQFVTCNNTTTTAADTGMAFAVSKLYAFYIFCALGDSTIYWQIDNLTDGTTASGSTSTTLPRTTTSLTSTLGINTVDAVSRTIRFNHLFVAADKG